MWCHISENHKLVFSFVKFWYLLTYLSKKSRMHRETKSKAPHSSHIVPMKRTPRANWTEGRHAPQMVWMWWWREKSLLLPGTEHQPCSTQSFTLLTELSLLTLINKVNEKLSVWMYLYVKDSILQNVPVLSGKNKVCDTNHTLTTLYLYSAALCYTIYWNSFRWRDRQYQLSQTPSVDHFDASLSSVIWPLLCIGRRKLWLRMVTRLGRSFVDGMKLKARLTRSDSRTWGAITCNPPL